jgi:moderate conductance mechanosensitive channel
MDLLEPLRQVAQDVLNPRQVATAIETGISIVLIALGAWLLLRISLVLVRRTTAWRIGHPAARMTPIIEGLLRYSILFTAVILMLAAVHVNVTPVLASATVLGVALGFGAQQIIRDLLAGVFLLSEGIVQTGDLVRVEAASGTGETGIAERITLRVTQIRKYSGELVTVPNGSITKMGNWSRDYARAVVEVLIPYGADVGAAVQAVRDAAAAWAAAHPDRRADPELAGITDLRDTGMVLQCAVLVSPGQQFAVASELRQHVLKALAQGGITPGAVSLPGSSASAGPPRTT